MNKTVKTQILAIRDTGLTNMLDIRVVCDIAGSFGYDELIEFIKQNRKSYVEFILMGKE